MKALIFDFDGVIVNSQAGWDKIVQTLYRKTFPDITEGHEAFRGRSEQDCYRYLCSKYTPAITLAEHMRNVEKEAQNIYRTVGLMPGIPELLGRLKKTEIPFGIGSSASRGWIEQGLAQHGLLDHFWSLATADDVPRAKPEPDVYLLAAKQLGMDPADCVVIEDARNGVRAAKSAGMYCIGYVQDGDTSRLNEADMHVKHFDELDDATLGQLFLS